MKKHLRGLLCLVLCAAVLFSGLIWGAKADEEGPSDEALQGLKDQGAAIRQELQDTKSRINSEEFRQAEPRVKKQRLDQQAALKQSEIDNILAQLAMYDALAENKQADVEELKVREQEAWSLYKTRMRAMEESGPMSVIAMIFQATSFSDMLFRLDAVRAISERDKLVYQEYLDAKEATSQAAEKVDALIRERDTVAASLDASRRELLGLLGDAEELISQLEQDKEAFTAYSDAIDEDASRIYRQILKLQEDGEVDTSRVRGSDYFTWPSPRAGMVTGLYGWSTHPITGKKTFHNGIDISGLGYGTQVLAADRGTVIAAAYSDSYGNYIVIDHGNRYTTLYAHMQSNLVSKGDTVERGDVIGLVGATGSASGPQLHFEIWHNGSREDPMDKFSGVVVESNGQE